MEIGNRRIPGCVLVFAAIAVIGCGILFAVYSYVNSVRAQGIQYEQTLTARFSANQATLDALVVGVREQVHIQGLAGEQLEQFIRSALEGRYGDDGFDTNSAMFLAVSEAYPDVNELAINWRLIQQYIADNRAVFRGVQEVLLDQIRAYDTWRNEDLLRSQVVRLLGFPSDNLRATVGDTQVTGEMALMVMRRLVLSGETRDAFSTGTYDGVFPTIPSGRE